MAYCCVPLCSAKSTKQGSQGLSFHEIPSRLDLREKWIKAISRKDWVPNSTSNYTRVCSRHFTPEDYSNVTKVRRLKPYAVPSVFDDFQDFLQEDEETQSKRNSRKRGKQLDVESLAATAACAPQSNDPGFVYDVTVIEEPKTPQEGEGSNSQVECDSSDDVAYPNDRGKRLIKTYSKEKQTEEAEFSAPVPSPPPSSRFKTEDKYRVSQAAEKHRLIRRCKDLQHKLETLQEKSKADYDELQNLKNDPYISNILQLKCLAEDQERTAVFLLDQIYNYTLPCPRWTKTTLQESAALRSISVNAYEHLRTNLLKLPSQMTLVKYKDHMENNNAQ